MRVDLIDVHVNERSRGWNVEGPVLDGGDEPVFEDRWYSLAVSDYDRSKTYAVRVGDEFLKIESREFHTVLEFERGVYFESASGPTDLCLCEQGGDGIWRETVRVTLYVVPSKIGWGNYKAMVQDLQSVCRALITDIRGKSLKSAGRGESVRPWRTHEEELDALSRTCRRLRPLVREIKLSPKTTMRMAYDYERTNRCRSPRGIATMLKRGIDPRQDVGERRCKVGRVVESRDVAEHRLLKAFLRLLLCRVLNCRQALAAEVRRLESERKYRTRTSREGETSLFETEDLPRIRRCLERDADASEVEAWLEEELSDGFWADLREEVFSPENTQFAENDYYLEAVNIILRYLRDTSHWGGTFVSRLMMKKNSRMYEQWVLVQLVAAFERQGVRVTSWDEIISRSVNRQFGFDLGKNTLFRAVLADGYEMWIRYEPWIICKEDRTSHPEETLCHFGQNRSTWNPDIVIELVRRTDAGCKAVYAIALDAKYSRRPTREMCESVMKYAKIRTTEGRYGRRVARQVWLVYPGEDGRKGRFLLDDEAMYFSDTTGIAYKDTNDAVEPVEQVFGHIVAMPGEKGESADDVSEVGVRPKRVFLDFAAGTLAYFRALTA